MKMRTQNRRRRGAVAVLAMLFLVLFGTLTLAMYSLSTANAQSASNLSDVARAHGAAESGLRWMNYRFMHMDRPETTAGVINATVMATLWPQIRQAVLDDMMTSPNKMMTAEERAWTSDSTSIASPAIGVEDSGATFSLDIRQSADPTVLTVTSTGRFGDTQRSSSMTFKVDKKVRFAVVGKVPIQLGRNTIVEGPVAMATPNKFPPLLMLSDFMHFDDQLEDRCEEWNDFLQGSSIVNGQSVDNHVGYDNRVSVNNPQELALATQAGFSDINGDTWIDEYDLFVDRFDANGDLAITQAEFTNPGTGQLYDSQLFAAIDSIGAPMYQGDPIRLGYHDGKIDNSDGYAKLRGNVTLATTATAWAANLASSGETINDKIQGTIAPTEPTQVPVKFGASPDDMIDLNPANFEQCADAFKAQTGGSGTISTSIAQGSLIQNKIISASAANGGWVYEESPKGSKNFQAVFKRPVFKNITFRNCRIPKGVNALFDNCKFEGVTFIEDERNILTAGGSQTTSSTEGMNWARRKTSGSGSINTGGEFKDTNGDGKWDQYKITGMGSSSFANLVDTNGDGIKEFPTTGAGSFSYGSGTLTTKGTTQGNNVRFDNCDFEGPVAGSYATAYTHFANSWEFTGETMFNNQWVDPNSGTATATIVSPQVNIEMGSFTDPNGAPSTLLGVVVAGNIDIRGSSNVDGSIIITGDGAGNTTLAYFGASDSSTDPGANPEGGYGKLNIRYNPYRALPDGILLPVDIMAQTGSYQEVQLCGN